MFSIANLLDRAMQRASIESDYRLAKVLGITHQSISQYRTSHVLPNDKVIAQLCALSGDDAGVIAAEIHAARSKDPEAKSMWMSIAARLSGGAAPAILSILFAIALVAAFPGMAEADGVAAFEYQPINGLYIVSSTYFVLTAILCSITAQLLGYSPADISRVLHSLYQNITKGLTR